MGSSFLLTGLLQITLVSARSFNESGRFLRGRSPKLYECKCNGHCDEARTKCLYGHTVNDLNDSECVSISLRKSDKVHKETVCGKGSRDKVTYIQCMCVPQSVAIDCG